MNKKGVLFGGLLSCLLLVGCANNDKPATDDSSKDTTEEPQVVVPTKVEIQGEYYVHVLEGQTYQIETTVSPEGASSEFVYEVEKPEVCEVSATGLVTTKALGSSKITVKSKHNENIKDSIIFYTNKIPDALAVYAITDDTKTELTGVQELIVNEPTSFGVEYGENAYYGMLAESSDPTTATVKVTGANKFQVEGIKVGTADITITSSVDATKKTTLKVSIVEPSEEVIPFEGTRFDFGEDVEATAKDDGTKTTEDQSYTVDGKTLVLHPGERFYAGAHDETGKVGLKLGTGDNPGSFTFTVDAETKSFAIYVGRYNGANAVKLDINGTEYDIKSSAQDGKYDEIIVDCSVTKEFTVASVKDKKAYCRIDAIVLSTNEIAKEPAPVDPQA